VFCITYHRRPLSSPPQHINRGLSLNPPTYHWLKGSVSFECNLFSSFSFYHLPPPPQGWKTNPTYPAGGKLPWKVGSPFVKEDGGLLLREESSQQKLQPPLHLLPPVFLPLPQQEANLPAEQPGGGHPGEMRGQLEGQKTLTY
jgi:hypothetical protein